MPVNYPQREMLPLGLLAVLTPSAVEYFHEQIRLRRERCEAICRELARSIEEFSVTCGGQGSGEAVSGSREIDSVSNASRLDVEHS